MFQGFIQGKDYGQFGLQRLGNVFIHFHFHVVFITLGIIRKSREFCILGTHTIASILYCQDCIH